MSAAHSSRFPIAGIGASAGGVEALEGFFSGLPDNPGLACVIVTHLSPERESLLHEIVGRYTDLAVHIAQDGTQVEVNQVYVLPADAILSIEQAICWFANPRLAAARANPSISSSAPSQ